MSVLDQPHELTQGALVYDSVVEADTPWAFTTLADGFDLGNSAPLVEEVRSLLNDGSLAEVVGHSNREIAFRLQIAATDGVAMAQAEAALMAEKMAERPSPLVYTPSMIDAWPAVFEVVHMNIERDYSDDWDLDERFRQHRFYRITLTCLPWTRDAETSTIPALPVPPDPDVPAVYTVVDSGDSTSGWETTPEPYNLWSTVTLGQQPGYLRGSAYMAGGSAASIVMALTRTGAVNMGGMPYLTVDIDVTWQGVTSAPDRLTARFDDLPVVSPIAVTAPVGASTWRRYYFEAPASFTTVRIRQQLTRGAATSAAVIRMYEMARTDRVEIQGSNGFQLARLATVGGTVPTQAAISLDAATDPLIGSTALIYTGASAAIPLRNLRISSAAFTPDATKISGATNDLSSAMVFRVPISQLTHSTYSLMARLEATGAYTVNWQARVVASDGTTIPGSDYVVSGAALVKNATADPWRIHDLAAIQLPTVAIEGSTTHAVELTLSMTSSGASVKIDEGWLLDTDNGAVTVIHEPSAFQLTSIELRSPQLDTPRPSVVGQWVTHGAQDITRLATALGSHVLKPGLLHVFTATDLAKYAACSLTYYQRYHTHPGPPLETEAAA